MPTISVIIPCFNAEKYVSAAIRSVLQQDWPQMEIIVIDDGSKDNSAHLVRNTFPQVKLIQQVNQGVAAARNKGIEVAKSEWIAFLDADDIWLPGKLAQQWSQLQANPEVRMNYTAWKVWQSAEPEPIEQFINELRLISGDTQAWNGPSGWIYPALLLDCEVWTSTVLAHRSVFQEIGNFDTTLRIGEDYDLWLRASRVTAIMRVSQPLALYRTHPGSITKTKPEKNYKGIVIQRALDRWGLVSPDGTKANKAEVYRALALTWSDFASASLSVKHFGQAWRAGMKSIWTYWQQSPGWKVLIKTGLEWFASSCSKKTLKNHGIGNH